MRIDPKQKRILELVIEFMMSGDLDISEKAKKELREFASDMHVSINVRNPNIEPKKPDLSNAFFMFLENKRGAKSCISELYNAL